MAGAIKPNSSINRDWLTSPLCQALEQPKFTYVIKSEMAKKQLAADRLERINNGCCPVHGLQMGQIDRWYYPKKGRQYTIIGCSRRACLITAKAYDICGPWELSAEFMDLINDTKEDPVYLDEGVLPEKRKQPVRKHKPAVFKKTNGQCYYCAREITLEEATIDHLVPEGKGGTHEITNLVPACKSCNSSKGTKSLEEFRFFLRVKAFDEKHGVSFTQNQLDFLHKSGFKVEIPEFIFWHEE